MKIALLGNMNNNNFVLMRYLRDIGLDAHLLLGMNDGKGHSSHFKPESDTFEMHKWESFIHQTRISEDIISSFNFPVSWLLSIRSYFRSRLSKNKLFYPPTSKLYLSNITRQYTHFIGSGITPALLKRINKSLYIFYPYAIGVEYYGDLVINANSIRSGKIGKFIFNHVKAAQKKGIKQTRIIINPERSLSEKSFNEIGVRSIPMFVPSLYNNDIIPKDNQIEHLSNVVRSIDKSSFSIISHARLIWNKPNYLSIDEWKGQNKNNDRLIRAFAKLVNCQKKLNPILILFEHGQDINITKKLIKELEINDNIIWLPKMDRKFILWIISKIDIGIGEFYDIPNMLWGGTAIEIMACGKPVIQSQDFSDQEFLNTYNTTLPPIESARTEEEIFRSLLKMSKSPNLREEIGKNSKIWFNKNNGEVLAKKWSNILLSDDN